MFIDRITIRDFQSIHSAEIELADWTSLVGESDVGKSAVVRALHAMLTNQRGDLFIRRQAEQCSVMLDMSDPPGRIGWTKARGQSGRYMMRQGVPGSLEETQATFEKTGGEVPPEVAAQLRVAVPVAGEQLLPGLQSQHDPPFLFAFTPRRRAQVLGEFDGTNILLGADGQLRKDLRARQAEATQRRTDAQTAEAALQELDWIDGAAAQLQAATDAHRALEGGWAREAHVLAAGALIGMRAGTLGVMIAALGTTPRAPELDWDQIAVMELRLDMMLITKALVMDPQQRLQVMQEHPLPPLHDLDHLDVRIATLGEAIDASEAAFVRQVGLRRAEKAAHEAMLAANVAAAALRELVGTACPECGQPLTAEALALP